VSSVVVVGGRRTISVRSLKQCLHVLQSLGSIQRRTGDDSWEQQHVKNTHFKWVENSKVNAAVLTNTDDVSALVSAILECHERGVDMTMITLIGLELEASGLIVLSKLFVHSTLKVRYLNLYQNNLGDQGASYFASHVLANEKCRLVDLKLSNNSIGAQGVVDITNALRTNKATTLEILKLGGNPNISDLGAAAVASVLCATNIHILKMSRCGITDKGAQAFLDVLRQKKGCRLVILRLKENLISDETYSALLQAGMTTTKITKGAVGIDR
jgi:Ran GTPase-activating protein (RanGAP) involved in mRNA processing and transport